MSSKLVAAAFLMTFAATSAAAAPTARFTARPVQGATCVAPCAVHFDAIGKGALSASPYASEETTDPDYTREFHSLRYVWDFGDNTPNSCGGLNATWTVYSGDTAPSRNAALGAIAGHVYCQPGTYSVTLRVTNPRGESSSVQHDVTVADPEAVFTDANTYCFANSGSNWSGCPLNCAGGDDNCTITSDYDLAINAPDNCVGSSDCANAPNGMRRIYFRRGDTFVRSGGTSFFAGATPGLVTGFGSGAKPIIQGNLNESGGSHGSWTWAGLRVDGGKIDNGESGDRLTFYDLDIIAPSNSGPCIFSTNQGGSAELHTLQAYVDVNCTGNAGSNTLVWVGMHYGMILGGIWDRNSSSGNGYTMRTKTWQHSVMSNTFWDDALVDHWQWRPEHNATALNNEQAAAQYIIVSDNVQNLPSHAGFPIAAKVCNDDACTCIGGGDACNPALCAAGGPGCDPTRGRIVDNHDWIFERNLIRFSGGAPGSMHAVFQLTGGDMTVRNNVVDLRGALSTGSGARLVDAIGETRHLSGSSSHANYHVFNNTVYSTTTGFAGSFMSSDSGTNFGATGCTGGCLDYNNLFVFTGNLRGTIGATDFTQLGLRVDADGTDPFDGALPAAETTDMGDFVPSQTESTIIDAGYQFNPAVDTNRWVSVDGRGLCRIDAVGWDIGAIERSAQRCSEIPQLPPPAELLPPTLLDPQ